MRKILKLGLLLVLCWTGHSSSAQLLLSSATELKQPDQQQQASVKVLREALLELETKYQVSIMYNSDLVANKTVAENRKSTRARKTGSLENELTALLQANGLKYDKISNKLYVITAAPLEKGALVPESNNNLIGVPTSSQPEAATILDGLGLKNIKEETNQYERTTTIALTVSGTVTSTKNEPLPGVTVLVKGTSSGTTTDANGNYTINVPDGQENGTLVFSFIGYTTQEVGINNRTTVNITLADDVKALEEVVVIGYQTVRKQDLTGAVSVINPAAANRVATNSVVESLQGLAPGVTVRNGGAPGQMARVEIRGAASFTNTDPLYVIDGMIADANTTINNNDIESMQVLKDASAAAIYGSRAANGVIIITTKQGREGPARVNASARYGVQQIAKRWDLMNASEFAAMQRTQYQNSNQTPPASVGSAFNPAIDTDWQDEVMRTGSLQDYNITLSGGSKTATYLVSGSYFTNQGVLIGNSFDRGTLRINTRSQKGRVTFGENLVLSNSNGKSIPGTIVADETNPFYNFPQMLPIIPVRGDQYISATNPGGWGIGTTNAITYATNPVAVANLSNRNYNYAKVVGNAYADLKIMDWLSYRFNTGVEVSFDHIKDVRRLGIWEFNAAPRSSSVDEERARYLSLLFEHTLNFNKTAGVHSINGVVGISSQHTTRETTAGGRTNLQIYSGEYLTTIGSGSGTSTAGGGRPIDYRIFGYLGRVNYTFHDRYLLTLTGRVDQDSRFGENNRTGFFPSVAVGWRISQENFMANLGWLSDLKLNASYGQLGIVPLNSWDYTAFINNSPRAVFGPDQTAYIGSTQARLANPNLKWEERIVQNIGIDASFLQNRISVSLEAYNSLSKDNLLQLPVAGYLGNLQGNPFINAGSIRNKGIEFAATYRSNENELKWDLSGNFTTIKNTVEDVGNQGEGIDYIQSGNTRTKVGRSLGEWYLLQTNGLFRTAEEVTSYTNTAGQQIQPNAKPGDIRYIDKDGNGTINADDRNFVGSPWPKLQTGAQFNASYRQFSLNMQLIGVFGFKLYNDVRRVLDSYQQTNFRRDISPWSSTNTDTDDPRIALNTEQSIIENNRAESERWLENGSYVRMRNLELGYNLPAGMLSRVGIQNSRIFISGQNLFTITKYEGLDPDVVGNTDPNNGQARILERGVDLGNWPASRVFSLGAQLDF